MNTEHRDNTAIAQELQTLRDEIAARDLTIAALQQRLRTDAVEHDDMLNALYAKENELRSVGSRQRDLAEFTQRMMDAVGTLIVVLDDDGRIKRINCAASAYLGINMPLTEGAQIETWFAPEEVDALRATLPQIPWQLNSVVLESARHRRRYRSEHRLRGADGSWRSFLLDTTLIHNRQGKEEGAVISATDIQALKDAETDLQLAASVFENSRNGITIASDKAVILRVNGAFTEILGYTAEECVGQPVRLISSGMHEPAFYREMWDRLNTHGHWKGEITDRHKDGHLVHMLQSIACIRSQDGKISHYAAIFLDISEKKALESELLKHRFHLELLVERRTAALEAARAEAQRLAQVKTEFLSNMSHEIRTPLNAVLGLAQVGQRENSNRRTRYLFDQMLASGKLLLGIIDDILDFSKIDAGKLAINVESIEVKRLLDNVMSLGRARAADKSLGLRLRLADTLPDWVSGDPLRISQILGNLLSNAVKFTERGEVVLEVTREDDVCVFQVRDTGIGLTDEQMGRLFSAFEQADTTTTRKFGGTGLGLAISKRLVELMGGQISVRSTPAVGSCFEVRLPLTEIDPPQAVGADSQEGLDLDAITGVQRLAGFRILAAEDNPVNQLVLDDMLTPEGATVTFANDGLQVLDLLKNHGEAAFDIVLTDIQMPNMDGHQLAQCLREQYPGLPVVGLTAHAMAEERQRCFDNGMVAHVTKPIEMGPLVKVVCKFARRSVTGAESAPGISTVPLPPDAPAVPRLPGCRILAAEDSPTNQQVLEYMLLPEGAILTFVADGQQALKLLQDVGEQSFDLVLTDIQMPNMDGHQLAQRLRELYPSLPVAGLTAHNLTSDRQRALAEGMVEHMVKPIEIDSLVTVVQKHARHATPFDSSSFNGDTRSEPGKTLELNASPIPVLQLQTSPEPLPLKEMESDTTDPAVIDWAGLTERFNGRQAFIDKLVKTTLTNIRGKAALLRVTAARGDYAQLAFIAHGLKGTGGNMQASRVSALGAQTEDAARAGAPEAFELAETLANAVEELIAALAVRVAA